jgi:hypothetical protein
MMSDTKPFSEGDIDTSPELQVRVDSLEQRLVELQKDTDARIVKAELKVEAVRAGMIDLDGLKLIELSSLKLNDKGEVDGASELMVQLKRAKPWLFGRGFTSSSANTPPAQPPRQKLASEMTVEEYREARAALLRRHK